MAAYEHLNRQKHDRLRFGPTLDYRFAAEMTLVPIIIDEITVVVREYPIIFPVGDIGLPCALVGMRPETNAFVDDQGQWIADYIPLKIRQHPFALAETPNTQQEDGKKQFSLCLDLEAEEFKDLEGARVFDSTGTLSPEVAAKGDLAKKLIERTGITNAMVRVLEKSELLVERSIKMRMFNDEVHNVQGFKVIDEKKLNGMPDEDYVALRNKGVMPLIYAQLMSMANLRQGLLAGQVNPSKGLDSGGPAKKSAGDFDLSMFASDDGDFDMSH
jgi:hypothetical protein